MINKYIYNSNAFNSLLSLYNDLRYNTLVLHTYIIFIGTIAPQIHLISKQPKRKNKMKLKCTNESYNGYTNKSTWAFMLWINNDYLMYGIAQGITKDNKDNIDKISTDLKEFANYLVNRDKKVNPKETTFSIYLPESSLFLYIDSILFNTSPLDLLT